MSPSSSIDTGRIAVLLAVMAIIGLVFIALFYGLLEQGGGPLGTLNDLCMVLGGILNHSVLQASAFPRGLAQFGRVAGGIMLTGIRAGPGIRARIDEIESAHWYVLVALFIGGLGWNILYTIWCMWLGRLLLSKRLELRIATTPH